MRGTTDWLRDVCFCALRTLIQQLLWRLLESTPDGVASGVCEPCFNTC
nr:MAG TPA: hypothetical protein [Caudoviricetes sp.]